MKHLSFIAILFTFLFSGSLLAESLFDLRTSPDKPVVGEDVTFLISLKSDWNSSTAVRPILEGTLNGNPINFISEVEGVWVVEAGSSLDYGDQELTVSLFFEKKIEADSYRESILNLQNEIDALNDGIANEQDPVIRANLITQRDTKIVEKQMLEQLLADLKEKIIDETFNIEVDSHLRIDKLKRNIINASNHSIHIQREDFGFPWRGQPDDFYDRSQTSYVNQFGLHALALIEAYKVTGEVSILRAVENTADALMNKTIDKCIRIFANDSEFLGKVSVLLGYSIYHQRMMESLQAEKDCLAAYHILDNPYNPTPTEIAGVTQAQLDTVTDVQRVMRFRERLVWAGRNAGLRAFDWGARIRAYLYAGDSLMAKAMADVVASDANSIVIENYYYLLGHSNTVSALSNWPEFQAVVDASEAKLIAQQQVDGLFQVIKNDLVEEGTVQDQAFSLAALFKTDSVAEIKKLTDIMIESQTPSGGYYFFEIEAVEGQSEFLEVLSKVYMNQTEKFMDDEVAKVPLRRARRYSKNFKSAMPYL